jgi:hypothetical protein
VKLRCLKEKVDLVSSFGLKRWGQCKARQAEHVTCYLLHVCLPRTSLTSRLINDHLHATRFTEARMELWACGFNAWGQLDFGEKLSLESTDLNTFKCVFIDQRIEILHMGLSSILRK